MFVKSARVMVIVNCTSDLHVQFYNKGRNGVVEGQSAGVLTIYMGKPEILVGKSNGSRHSIWETSKNMGCDLR